MCSTTYDIPIGIYRTDPIPRDKDGNKETSQFNVMKKIMRATNGEIEKIVQTRMEQLGITDAYSSSDETNEFSYVIINPSYDLTLKTGDVM